MLVFVFFLYLCNQIVNYLKMKKVFVLALLLSLSIGAVAKKEVKIQPQWPDGSVMSEWFADTAKVDVAALGRQYVITDYGVALDSTIVQTERIQQVIDR